ncbi:MAG: Ig-like domain-containing protein, partial [Desulfobacteraceae bacterium]
MMIAIENKKTISLITALLLFIVSAGVAVADDNLSIGAGSDGSGKASGTSYSDVRDGDMSTYWSPTGSTGRVSIKWSSYTTVGTVVIKEAEGFEGNIGSWSLVNHDTGEELDSGSGAGTISFGAVSLTKIDFVITSSSGTPAVAEFETYGEATTEPDSPSDEETDDEDEETNDENSEVIDTPADEETNLVNLSIGAGSDGSGKAKGTSYSYVRDGDMSTYWSPAGSTGRVSIKWSSSTTVATVVIKEAEGFEGNIGSWDLVNHDTGEVLDSGSGAGTISFDAVSLKKINFIITSSSDTPGVAEFETYGEATTEPDSPSDEETNDGDEETILVTDITINASDITDGSRQQLEAAVTPSNASNQTLTWSVDDESIATISSTGLLTPVAEGQVTVTAEATDGSGVKDTAAIDISGVATGTIVSSEEELLSAIESAASGSTIYVRAGTYYFDSTISLEQDG